MNRCAVGKGGRKTGVTVVERRFSTREALTERATILDGFQGKSRAV